MGQTVQYLLTGKPGLGPNELDHWWAFSQLEPFGNQWYQTAMLCSTVVNYPHGATRWVRPEDFMPQKRRTAIQDSATMHRKFVEGMLGSGRTFEQKTT